MAYRMSLLLGVASMALAHDLPVQGYGPESADSMTVKLGSPLMQHSQPSETGSPYATLTPASGTGVLPSGVPTGVFPSGGMTGTSGLTVLPSGMPTGYPGLLPPIEPYPSGPTCLKPKMPKDHDYSNPAHVKPSDKQTLHYGAGDTSASLAYDLSHPSVHLEAIDEFTGIQCPSNSEIVFKLGAHYSEVASSWPKSGEPLILIDGSDFCGKPGQRTFFNVTEYTTDKQSKTFKGHGKMHSGGDSGLIKGFKLDWQHSGSPGGKSPSTATQAPQVTPPPMIKSLAKRLGWGDIPGVGAASSALGNAESKVGGVVSNVKSKGGDIVTGIETKASAVISDAGAGISGLKSDAEAALHKTEAVSKVISINEQPTGTAASPWGPAKSLGTVDGVTIYCVKCGATGTLSLGGSIAVGLPDGIKEGAVDISAKNLDIPMVFGFQAENAKSPNLPLKVQIFSAGLVPFEIPDVFVIGPMLTVDVSFNLQVSASGNLEAGLDFKLDDAEAHMDLVNKDPAASNSKGWTPTVDKTFEMSAGQLDVNGTFGVPISLGLGINILDGRFDRNISITDTPSIELDTIVNTPGNQKRAYEDRNHARDLLVNRQDNQCANGIQEIISLANDVVLNVADFWSTDLAPFTTQVFSTCIPTGSGSASGGPGPTGSSGTGVPTSAPANPTAPASSPGAAPPPSSAPAYVPPPTTAPAPAPTSAPA